MNKTIAIFDTNTRLVTCIGSYPEDELSKLRDILILDSKDFIECDTTAVLESYVDHNRVLNLLPPKPSKYHTLNIDLLQWEDNRTLSELQDIKWANIKVERNRKEFSYFEYENSLYDCNKESQQRILGAVSLANLNPNIEIQWTLADNSTKTLTSQQILELGARLADHVITTHNKSRLIRDAIYNAKSIDELNSISWV